jgi:hypothetical protein
MKSLASDEDLIRFAQIHFIPLNGVYAKDELPRTLQDGGYIVNMDNSTGMGTHWTAVWIETIASKRRAVYFDSFGQVPPTIIETKLKGASPPFNPPFEEYLYNDKIIQNPMSGYCGAYSLVFIFLMHRLKAKHPKLKERLKAFQNLWSRDVEDNLRVLKWFIAEGGLT